MPPLDSVRMAWHVLSPLHPKAKRLRNREACSPITRGWSETIHTPNVAPGAATSCTIRLFGTASSLAPCMPRTRHIGPLHTQATVSQVRAVIPLSPSQSYCCSVRCPLDRDVLRPPHARRSCHGSCHSNTTVVF
jgi:hypothetical protein